MSNSDYETKVLDIVNFFRSLMPNIGCLKLFQIVEDITGKHRGYRREKFFDLMHEKNLVIPPRKTRHTTRSNHVYFKYPNVAKSLDINCVNALWVADITYIPLAEGGTCYLHLVTDYYSRAILGYIVSPTLEAVYSVQALEQAIAHAGGGNLCGTTHHSDRGVQYASDAYTTVLKDHHIRISMCERYNPTDNGLAERVNGILKTEWIYKMPLFTDICEAMERVAHIVDIYNNVRPHKSLSNATPMSVYKANPYITPSARWYQHCQEQAAGSAAQDAERSSRTAANCQEQAAERAVQDAIQM